MKKLLLVPLLILGLIGCTPPPNKSNIIDKSEYKILLIDKCEYVYVSGLYASVLTHKGDCKNPIHIYRR